ncbi:uncharacterized protein LACBIDRAFT_314253 [Laccaria bicolor S238N-H82]|uniref:Predicted protein n=1 Tax=Laccaria bicolor (strain S238N-H82 / ATCC MYA-4686) TaxID=486041 RepID=B0D1X5_LACBS|nr:uncharacterized protein LACBIDRAFT_314253 [Laccaria bicolor S238N-H82]EDR11718.1 predicted protein [Laccaria bicolor S238N-H82]|eukprot:XP_001877615.1 predicted protein [Laccaria bicolor S238N-H82]
MPFLTAIQLAAGDVPAQVLPPPATLAEKPPQQNAPPPGTPWGYVRLAIMDGKTIGHRLCALDDCKEDLINYKNGRFCRTHINLKDICGNFGPTLQVQQHLPALNNTPGPKVVHTFRAQTVYCLQTIQWACGVPIGWGKCYKSESAPQVLAILDRVWVNYPDLRPSFLAYDDACDLLRHVTTQDAQSLWLKSTKFIVDAWHYIGHRATDLLCCIWCNPAPTNGSQPDLVITEVDDAGATHTTRAFNTETAEQLNSWLDGFEAQLRQMSATNYDFFVHVLMLVYKETVEDHILHKDRDLSAEFWNQAAA